jgi:AmmeMemoRadiSam system protein A
MPLFRAVVHNACAAGFHDTRFEPVGPMEVPELTIEISLLSLPSTISGTPEEILGQLRPHVDGVLIEHSGSMVTFLPQVWEKLSDRTQFMQRLCQKAGWDRNCWRSPQTTVSVYQVESFESSEHE